MTSYYKIEAFWDHEVQVWVAESSDILGLATEADNLDRLTNKLKQMIPELLAANHQMAVENNKNIAFELITHRQELILNTLRKGWVFQGLIINRLLHKLV